jgi:beta-galactosidase
MDHYSAIAQDPMFDEAIMDRVQRNVIRDKNEPSVIIWSLGNESGYGESFEKAGRWIKEYDDSRLTHYENCHVEAYGRKNDTSMIDLESRMYYSTESIDEYFKDGKKKKPFIQCEFIHAMGNGPGDIEDYMKRIFKYDGFVGGFAWEWCDHAVYGGRTPDNKQIYRYGGDFGEFPNDGNFCMDGLVYPDRRPHTGLLEYKNCLRPIRASWKDQSSGEVELHNILDFTNISDYAEITCDIQNNGTVVRTVDLGSPDIPPHESIIIKIKGLKNVGNSDIILRYSAKKDTLYCKKGYEIGFDQLICSTEGFTASKLKKGSLEINENGNQIAVAGKTFRYVFSKKSGLFDSMVKENTALLSRPMEYQIYRAPTDNDMNIKKVWCQYGYDRITQKVYDCTVANDSGIISIKCKMSIAAVSIMKFIDIESTFAIDSEGSIDAKIKCSKNPDFPFLPRFGIRMFMPQSFNNVEYYGFGPNESYEDKHRSSYRALFSSKVANMHEDYIKPQENSSHYACSYMSINDDQTTMYISTDKLFSFNASVYTREELTAKKHNYELVPSGGTVLSLDYRMSGVGSNSCGPELLPQYRLSENKFEFDFNIRF